MRHVVAKTLIAIGILAGCAATAQAPPEVLAAIRQRAKHFDRVRVEFDWLACRAPLDKDPFDPHSWMMEAESAFRYHGRMTIVRPNFRFHLQGDSPWKLGVTHTWIDGRRTTLTQDQQTRRWTAWINENRWGISGGMPYYTPFELALCDIPWSLVDLLENSPCSIHVAPDGEVVVACNAVKDWPLWKVRATLDPDEDCVPLELSVRVDFENHKHIYWTVRTIDRIAVGDTFIIGEAIFALDSSSGQGLWQIYHYKVTDARYIPDLAKEALRIHIPEKNVFYQNDLTGYCYQKDAQGRLVKEKHFTAAEMQERKQRLEEERRMTSKALVERQERYHAPRIIVLSSLGAGVLVAGGWLWFRRKHA